MEMPYVFSRRTMNELWAIAFLQGQFRDILEFLENHYYYVPENVRRLISHAGVVRLRGAPDALARATGADFTNVIYALVWGLLLDEAPPWYRLQSISNPVSCGNMLESLMTIASSGPSSLAILKY